MRKLTTADFYLFKKAALTLRAINNPLRHKIMEALEKGEMSVTTLYTKLKLEQSAASQHLAILRKAGIVTTTRNGKEIIYKFNTERIAEIESASLTLITPGVKTVVDDHDTE